MSRVSEPLTAGALHLKNRLLMASVNSKKASPEGKVTQELIDHYVSRAEGFALVVLEHASVSPWDRPTPNVLCVDDDTTIAGLSQLAAAIHEKGAAVHIQLEHGGGFKGASLRWNEETRGQVTEALTESRLREMIEDFGQAAARAEKAGLDGVQIKACHFYAVAQFLSPLTNIRKEGEYRGESFETRTKLLLDIVRNVRKSVSDKFIVSVRLTLSDYAEGGFTVEECIRLSQLLEKEKVDYLDLSGGVKYSYLIPGNNTPGWFGADAKKVREAVSIPVAIAGGIATKEDAESVLSEQQADLISIGRAVIKDANWAKNIMAQ